MDAEESDGTAVFEEHRPVLLGVAYRMLGRVADAEDVVQDTWLRWASADRAEVRRPRAFLVRATTRLALDRLRSAQSRRETYVGPWLPEPLPTDVHAEAVPDGADRVILAESVSVAVLVVLESLSPLERAVFVLREAFGFPHEEIAAALDRTPAAVRQLAARARSHVAERTPRYEVDPGQQRELTQRFLDAATRGDLDGLLAMLAPDARLVGDGGGKAKAPMRTITSAGKVGRFMAAIAQQGVADLEFEFTELNGATALVGSVGGKPTAVMLLDVADGVIQSVYLVANPDKLAHLQAP
ncbi:RNA polymerase sigma-70 factor [Streptomyces sp. WMMB 322]|uniref:RNA polymerase sigma-70 factor n=1 Tax=Streptomyces sp. WMMB 322 TaxID=1286821 RepID=UPI0006E36C0D|nr:RNA polymerase sigma-70 factor [Streptomyces sp. WMMB 322]SCK59221.1 RNA polymerase sigma-70 factor, ECF subfamily [Streptomyces sp. WMMB 322]